MKMHWCIERKLTQFKAVEFEILGHKEWQYFDFRTAWTRKQDHAGIKLEIELVGIVLYFTIHDIRHWNYEKDRWYEPGEEGQEVENGASISDNSHPT